MKYLIQLLTGCVMPFMIWFLSSPGARGGISPQAVNVTFKWINVFGFSFMAILSLFMYAFFVNKEVKSSSEHCYTKAQWQSLLGFISCLALALATYNWIRMIQNPASTLFSSTSIDIVYAIADFSIIIYILMSNELKLNIFFKRTVLPWLPANPNRKKALQILVDDGIITQEQKEAALEKQKKGE